MPEILHQLTIATDPDSTFEALTSQNGLANWWSEDVEAQPVVGSTITIGFRRHTVVFTMRVADLKQPSLVVWECIDGNPEWVGTEIRFEISRTPDRTMVKLLHTGWDKTDGMLAACSFDWARYLLSLKAYLETGQGRPYRG